MSFVAGTAPTAAALNAANVKIIVGAAGPTASAVAGSTTPTVLTGTSISVTVPTGGSVALHIVDPDVQTNTTGFGYVSIGVRRAGTLIGDVRFYEVQNNYRSRLEGDAVIDTPAGGTYTYDLQRSTFSSAGTYSLNSGAFLIATVYGPP